MIVNVLFLDLIDMLSLLRQFSPIQEKIHIQLISMLCMTMASAKAAVKEQKIVEGLVLSFFDTLSGRLT